MGSMGSNPLGGVRVNVAVIISADALEAAAFVKRVEDDERVRLIYAKVATTRMRIITEAAP